MIEKAVLLVFVTYTFRIESGEKIRIRICNAVGMMAAIFLTFFAFCERISKKMMLTSKQLPSKTINSPY